MRLENRSGRCGSVPTCLADEQLEQVRQQVETSLHYLSMIQPLPAPVFTPIEDQNWMESWKQHYQPIEVGERLLILPAWIDPPETERQILKIDPGMAFGTGTHPTTQLSLDFARTIPAARRHRARHRLRLWDLGRRRP